MKITKQVLMVIIAANKAYFHHKNGIQLFCSIFKNENNSILIRQTAGSCLWNYIELDYQRKIAANCGVIDLTLYALKSSDLSLANIGIGILWGIVEYEDMQEMVMKADVFPTIISLIQKNRNNSHFIKRCIGCIHLISCNANCRPQLDIRSLFTELFNLCSNDDLIEKTYFCCLTLANLISDQRHNIQQDMVNQAAKLIVQFMQLVTPQEIRKIEQRDHYVWVSLKPFVDLTISHIPEVRKLGMFALANLTCWAPNRELIHNGGYKDDIIAAAISMRDGDFGEMILSNFGLSEIPKLSCIIRRQHLALN